MPEHGSTSPLLELLTPSSHNHAPLSPPPPRRSLIQPPPVRRCMHYPNPSVPRLIAPTMYEGISKEASTCCTHTPSAAASTAGHAAHTFQPPAPLVVYCWTALCQSKLPSTVVQASCCCHACMAMQHPAVWRPGYSGNPVAEGTQPYKPNGGLMLSNRGHQSQAACGDQGA